MVKKLKELAGEAADMRADMSASNLAQTVRESAQHIWLAGLGAFGKAQEEGGKVFEALVKEGKTLESKTRKLAGSAMEGLSAKVGRNTMAAASKATATWDTLEQVFQDRVARAMSRMGMPTSQDMASLVARLEQLEKAVGTRAPAAGRARAGVKAAAKKSAVKKSVAKKVAKRAAKRPA